MKKLLLLLGRICLSLIFVSSAVAKLFSWDMTLQYMADGVARWVSYTTVPDFVHHGAVFLGGHTFALLVVTTILEGLGGLCVLFGIKIRFGATLLLLFAVPVTVVMHTFWMMAGDERMLQMTMFMKNLSIIGGLLILAATCDDEA